MAEPRTASVGARASLELLRRNPDFRRLYFAQLISFGGDWFMTVALFGLVHMLTGSAIFVALTITVPQLAFFLLSPVGGALADRLDRRRLMIVADLARACLCLPLLLVDSQGRVWLVFVLQASISVFEACFEPASSAAIPNVVDPEDLAAANSLVGSAWGTMLAVGAAAGGLVVTLFGRDAAIMGNSLSFLLSAWLLWRVRRAFSERRDEHVQHPGILEATRETAAYARRDHRVLALLGVKAGFGLAAGVLVLIAVFATDVFREGDIGIGLLMASRGVGALIGPFLGRALAGPDDRRLFGAIGLALAVFGISYMVFGLSPSLVVAAPIVLCAHLGGGAQWTLSTYGLQRLTPDRIRGRIFAFDYALVTLSLGVSSFVAGWLADTLGPRPAVIGLGGVALGWSGTWWMLTRDIRRRAAAVGLASPGTP
ncbi:MAG: MFS transporter [Actinobacteria bacterium]|nr:MFS transporter [Actinomycetota bacterium]